MGAKRKGIEVRHNMSIRLEPAQKELIIKLFGSVQVWIDHCLKILQDAKNEKV